MANLISAIPIKLIVYQDKPSERVHLIDTLLGLFAVDEEGEPIDHVFYPREVEAVAEALERHLRGDVTPWLEELLNRLKGRGVRAITTSNRGLAEASMKLGLEAEAEASEAERRFRGRLGELAVELGLIEEAGELHQLSHRVSEYITRRRVSEALAERETHIAQAVHLLANLDKALNALSSNLREWYGIHFPELSQLVSDHETYARIIAELGGRDEIDVEGLRGIGVSAERSRRIVSSAKSSIGAPLMESDLNTLRELAGGILSLYECRRRLEDYLTALMEEVAPNLSRVAGPILAAKLVEKAGGLRRLAMMPSSKIQLLGAEKALFRALRKGGKMPKHGLIFQHPLIHRSPRGLRGRAARLLASQLALAARADAFTGAPIGDRLRDELEGELEALRKNR
ncbi:C/D box methylation guide ribonucleoprotein complex aNOP56 subunit [Candidatus Bathyarchaeota archaeon]|nr:MAG: C/D box methylation guide ribonucleoprotein complex aNOP56 subunit [Candidatus Bathyarchaeota archaeon]